jgi:flagellin
MGLQINTNVGALNAYRNLSGTQNAMSTSLERLSSGLRINRAADDAAGLAISEKLRSQISGLQKASSNAQDGISLIQTGEGALNESHSILQRMRELSVQAANDTNTDTDRKQIQKEVDQLSQELSRIGNSTQFNGKSLLNGDLTATPLKLQIGANAGQNLSVSISDMRGRALGVTGTSESTIDTAATKGSVTGNGTPATNLSTAGAAGTLKIVVDGDTANAVSVTGFSTSDTAAQTAAKINTALGTKGSAAIDANGKLAITSAKAGVGSSIAIDSTSTDKTVEDLGLQTAAVTASGGVASTTATAGTAGPTAGTLAGTGNVVFGAASPAAGTLKVDIDAGGTPISKTINLTAADFVDQTALLAKLNDTTNGLGTAGTASISGGKLTITSATTGTTSSVAVNTAGSTGATLEGLGFQTPTVAAAPKAANVTTANGAAGVTTVSTAVVTNGTGTNALDFGSYSIGAVNASNIADVLDSSGTKVATYNSSTGDIKDLTSSTNTLATVASGSRPATAWKLEIHGVDVSTQAAASAAVSTMDAAISKVSDQRSTLGSVQNRLQHTINNLGVAAENLTASESRIRDTDMAKEMTSFTRAQILSQAGISMLAQANQAPQSVLKLLG